MNAERLAKLLRSLDALAARPGTPEEGDAARQKAAQFRAKYQIPDGQYPAAKQPTAEEVDAFMRAHQQRRHRSLEDVMAATGYSGPVYVEMPNGVRFTVGRTTYSNASGGQTFTAAAGYDPGRPTNNNEGQR